MGHETTNGETSYPLQTPPELPPGYDKHHIVYLEAVNIDIGELPFPHTIELYPTTKPEQIAERIKPATIVISNIANVTPSDMDQAPYLKMIVVIATGMGWVDKGYCAKNGITVTNTPNANIDAVSEHFLGLYFASRKRIPAMNQMVKTSDQWQTMGNVAKAIFPSGPPLGCKQETIGIVGYGALGKRLEILAGHLNFKEVLLAERRGADSVRPGRVAFKEILQRCTTIVITCPKGPDTINLIDEAELKQMKKEALVINIARGGIVNEAALAKALKEGWISGAATDVFDDEPSGPGSTPLLPDLSKGEEEVPNLIVTPHLAWYSGSTTENYRTIYRAAMHAFVEGRLLDPSLRDCIAVHDGRIWK